MSEGGRASDYCPFSVLLMTVSEGGRAPDYCPFCVADDNVRGWASAGLLSLLFIADDKQYQRVGQRRITVHFLYSRWQTVRGCASTNLLSLLCIADVPSFSLLSLLCTADDSVRGRASFNLLPHLCIVMVDRQCQRVGQPQSTVLSLNSW